MMKRFLAVVALLLAGTPPVHSGGQSTGKEVFNQNCIHCHAPGREHPGTLQLGLTRGADRAVLEERTDLTAEYVRHIVRHGIKAMPAFVPSQITDDQLNALTDYLTR
jgi:mono/diheme cytochrome c family protein